MFCLCVAEFSFTHILQVYFSEVTVQEIDEMTDKLTQRANVV